jgi:hypothetical protein
MGAGPESRRSKWPNSPAAACVGLAGVSFSLPQVMHNKRIFIGYFVCGYTISTQGQVALIASE